MQVRGGWPAGQHKACCAPNACTGTPLKSTALETPCSAGYALTVPGPNGTHVPSFVATDEQNSTVMGMVVNVWEAGSVDAPR